MSCRQVAAHSTTNRSPRSIKNQDAGFAANAVPARWPARDRAPSKRIRASRLRVHRPSFGFTLRFGGRLIKTQCRRSIEPNEQQLTRAVKMLARLCFDNRKRLFGIAFHLRNFRDGI